jgi:hypothetical protein
MAFKQKGYSYPGKSPAKKTTTVEKGHDNPEVAAKSATTKKSMKDFALNSQARRDEYDRRGWAHDATSSVTAKPKAEAKARPDAKVRGVNQDGATTTKKSREGKSDTLVVSEGRTKGGSKVVNKDYTTPRADQTPEPDISKTKRKDRKKAMEGMNRQERKNYRDLQDTKKDMRKTSAKAQKAADKGPSKKEIRRKEKDAERNKALVAEHDARKKAQKEAAASKKADTDKEARRDAMVSGLSGGSSFKMFDPKVPRRKPSRAKPKQR